MEPDLARGSLPFDWGTQRRRALLAAEGDVRLRNVSPTLSVPSTFQTMGELSGCGKMAETGRDGPSRHDDSYRITFSKKGHPMAQCEVCGNDYDKTFQVPHEREAENIRHSECAIQALAPVCSHCRCRVIGHGVEQSGTIFRCAHCAKQAGARELRDRS